MIRDLGLTIVDKLLLQNGLRKICEVNAVSQNSYESCSSSASGSSLEVPQVFAEQRKCKKLRVDGEAQFYAEAFPILSQGDQQEEDTGEGIEVLQEFILQDSHVQNEEVNLHQQEESQQTNPLVLYLEETIQGQCIVGLHALGKLDNSARCSLSSLIITREFGGNPNTTIRSSQFVELSKAIVEAFPGENISDYYIPPCDRFTKHNAAGKLYDAYVHINRKLRLAGRRKRQCHSAAHYRSSIDCVHPHYEEVEEEDAQLERKLDFLKTHVQPWDEIKKLWEETSNLRQNRLRDPGNTETRVADYISRYPALLQPGGHLLLEHDFEVLFPTCGNRFVEKWGTFSAKLKEELLKIHIFEHLLNSDAALLFNFPQLFNVVVVKVPHKKPWRASMGDIQDGFLVHIQDIGDLEKRLSDIRATALQRGTQVQPLPVVVGKTPTHITSSYVVIDNRPILVESPLRAVEVTLKSYHALYSNYPIQSSRLWVVLAQALMGIEEPWHGCVDDSPKVRNLIRVLK